MDFSSLTAFSDTAIHIVFCSCLIQDDFYCTYILSQNQSPYQQPLLVIPVKMYIPNKNVIGVKFLQNFCKEFKETNMHTDTNQFLN